MSDVGKKGDGIGKHMDYIVVVPGTARGNSVQVKITNLSGKTAFGTISLERTDR
ncbi:MAG: TRAM domain-containing protein [Candidatus Methanoplasma sp.]|nr:TRAM domain-containing protein [Candidatus Methanoplasma sp.]